MIFHFSILTSTWLWWLWLFTKAMNFLDMAVWLWQLGLICHFLIQCITIYYISFCVFFYIILITILFIILGVASSSSLIVLSSPRQHCEGSPSGPKLMVFYTLWKQPLTSTEVVNIFHFDVYWDDLARIANAAPVTLNWRVTMNLVLNCQKCDQCLKYHKSLGSIFQSVL